MGGEPQSETEAAVSPEAPRRTSTLFILAFLAFQLAMPLRYYLGGRGDDERFSWRMFSSVRMQRCSVRVRETLHNATTGARETHEVKLEEAVQIAWIGMLERDRPQVVTKLLKTRCRGTQRVYEARYERSCAATDGSALPPLVERMDCATGRITREGGAP